MRLTRTLFATVVVGVLSMEAMAVKGHRQTFTEYKNRLLLMANGTR
jgi:hypothetical protein